MKKVLVIGYLNRPHQGSYRLHGLVKYLTEFGWQPIIITPPPEEEPDASLRVIPTSYRDALGLWKRIFRLDSGDYIGRQVKQRFGITGKKPLVDRVIRLGGEIIGYPDLERAWKSLALTAAHDFLSRESVDAIISSSPPVTCQLVASELKARYKIPWVVDLPDLWSQNHNYQYSPIRKVLDRRLELKTLSKTDALVTVSQPWVEKLKRLHQGKPVYAIPRGFEPEEVNHPPADLTAKFTITYTGSIYTGKQDPTKLLAALRDLISDGTLDAKETEVRFYGSEELWLDKEIEQYGLSGVVKQYGRVPRQTALEKQRESQLLLLLRWEDAQESGVYTGKVFEYLGAARPILAIGGSTDVVEELLNETKSGICAATVEDVKKAIADLYQEYKLKGGVAYKGEQSKVEKHSYREVASKFSQILNQLV